MKITRFLLAAGAGGLVAYWLLFLFVAGDMAGEIYWTGYNRGVSIPGYLVSLYAPPTIAALLAYFALRKSRA